MNRERYPRSNILIPAIIFLLISVIALTPLFKNLANWGQMDWDQFAFWNAVARESILRYHQFPLWNPYSNGGNVLLAHPHSAFLSPLFFIIFTFGPLVGLKLEIVLHLFIGLLGMFLLSRQLNLSKRACYLPPLVYMLTSIYALQLAEGHMDWLSMAFLPWVFLCYLKGLKTKKYVLGSIFFSGLMLFSGSIYVFAVTMTFLSIYSILNMLKEKKASSLQLLSIIYMGVFLFCAIKIVPMLEFIKHNPRKTKSVGTTKISMLPSIFLSREQNLLYQNTKWTNAFNPDKRIRVRGREFQYGWHEYAAYTGVIPLILALIGLSCYLRQHWPLCLSGILFFWISLGEGAGLNLWRLIHKLPGYDSLHIPCRFILGFIFAVSLFSGLGLSRMENAASGKKYAKFLVSIIIAVVLVDLLLVNYPIWRDTFTIEPPEISRHTEFRQRYRYFNLFPGKIRAATMYPAWLSNSGIVDSYEVITVNRGDVKTIADDEYRGEVYLLNPDNQIKHWSFSPNRVEIIAELQIPDRLVVNQNYCQGWMLKLDIADQPAIPFNGLVSAELLPGRHKIVFYYLPKSFIVGEVITLVSMMSLIIISCRAGSHRSKKYG